MSARSSIDGEERIPDSREWRKSRLIFLSSIVNTILMFFPFVFSELLEDKIVEYESDDELAREFSSVALKR